MIVGIGIDTLSPDSESEGFSVHHLILGAGKNVVNAAVVSPIGAYAIALPLKIQDGTESPIRLIAAIPQHNS